MPMSRQMYFIDTSPEESHKRIEENRIQKEMFESLEKLRTVHEKVLELAQRDEWTIIDGSKSVKKIHEEIKVALMI